MWLISSLDESHVVHIITVAVPDKSSFEGDTCAETYNNRRIWGDYRWDV